MHVKKPQRVHILVVVTIAVGLTVNLTPGARRQVSCFRQVESAVQLLRGRIYEAMDNRSQAVDCYRAALLLDVRCYEAFSCLVQHHMMSA